MKLRSGWNNISGDYVKDILGKERTGTTNSQGQFSFSMPIEAYTAEISKNRYITGYCNMIAGSEAGIQTFVLTPVLSEDEYHIVLTWGSASNDLDSHLTYYVSSMQQMHVYFGNKTGWYDGEVVASLDLDDASAFVPETVTLTLDTSLIENGVFKYSVHKYSSSGTFAYSDAVVRGYKGNTYYSEHAELKQYTLQTLVDMYRKEELDELWELCGSVEMEELKTYYKKLRKMCNDEFELTPDSYGINAIVDEEHWYGVYYDDDGEIRVEKFYRDGATKHTPSDDVALEIVDWMDTIMEGIIPED